ncbi:hypothetical protein PUR61_38685 [Streptomyces sp. BE20]|uniref:hypothetical protein n=1 Tax=Streptomyces sp. BE20 TaxID=3002525 RepID=UPI002E7A00E7|nr:hypothetical protein [Streptomyces sp. BE20]MEE1828064.1 hypothetical protein [Streptomyces sp. BE20]
MRAARPGRPRSAPERCHRRTGTARPVRPRPAHPAAHDHACLGRYPPGRRIPECEEYFRTRLGADPQFTAFVIVDGGHLLFIAVGWYTTAVPRPGRGLLAGEIASVATDPDLRRQGHGRRAFGAVHALHDRAPGRTAGHHVRLFALGDPSRPFLARSPSSPASGESPLAVVDQLDRARLAAGAQPSGSERQGDVPQPGGLRSLPE